MRVFLDANVLFSAANRESGISRLVQRLSCEHSVMTSDYAFEEALRNIRLKRPRWEKVLLKVMAATEIITSIDRPVPCEIAPKDRPILATAIKSQCEFLITGDKRDFGHLFNKSIGNVQVITPLHMAEILRDSLSCS